MNICISAIIRARAVKFGNTMCYYCAQIAIVLKFIKVLKRLRKSNNNKILVRIIFRFMPRVFSLFPKRILLIAVYYSVSYSTLHPLISTISCS